LSGVIYSHISKPESILKIIGGGEAWEFISRLAGAVLGFPSPLALSLIAAGCGRTTQNVTFTHIESLKMIGGGAA
jgi:hypothetical protein